MAEATVRGARLVAIASEAIADPLCPVDAWITEPWLREAAATFVTLRRDGALRGCIGTIDPRRPLGEDVAHNARAAAFHDPRFPPVPPTERQRLAVEVSVLSPREPMHAPTEAAAASGLRPGVDGVYLQYGSASSTFLPQVWESIADPLEFLGELRRKAGLPSRFWHPDVRLWRYSVEKYS